MKRVLVALALVWLLAPADARPLHGCGFGETRLRNGACASLHPLSSMAPNRVCPGGYYADSLGRCPRVGGVVTQPGSDIPLRGTARPYVPPFELSAPPPSLAPPAPVFGSPLVSPHK